MNAAEQQQEIQRLGRLMERRGRFDERAQVAKYLARYAAETKSTELRLLAEAIARGVHEGDPREGDEG